MRRVLRVKRHQESYNFSYGKLKGSFQFYAHKNGEAKEWLGTSSMEIQLPWMECETAEIHMELMADQEKRPNTINNKLKLVENLSLGAAEKPLSVPGPLPRVPLNVFLLIYPNRDSSFQLKLTHDLNEKLARIYNERTLVEFGYEIGCGVQTEGNDKDKGASFVRIPYVFGPREKRIRSFDPLKKPLDLDLLPAAQQLARKTLLRSQKKQV